VISTGALPCRRYHPCTGRTIPSLAVKAKFFTEVQGSSVAEREASPLEVDASGQARSTVTYPSIQEIWPVVYSMSSITAIEVSLSSFSVGGGCRLHFPRHEAQRAPVRRTAGAHGRRGPVKGRGSRVHGADPQGERLASEKCVGRTHHSDSVLLYALAGLQRLCLHSSLLGCSTSSPRASPLLTPHSDLFPPPFSSPPLPASFRLALSAQLRLRSYRHRRDRNRLGVGSCRNRVQNSVL